MLRRFTCILTAVVAGFAGMCSVGVAAEEKEAKEEKWEYLLPDSFGGDLLKDAASFGTWKGELGMQFRSEQDYEDSDDDGDAGWGYLEASWLSGSMSGLQVGLGGLFVTEWWADDNFENLFDTGGDFEENSKWTEAYLKYTLADEKTYFVLGRAGNKLFGKPATGDGDYYEGVGVTTKVIPRLTLRAHVMKEWLNNASASWDLDGIDKDWEEMDDAIKGHDFGGELAYTLMGDIDLGFGKLSPYVQTQSDVGTSYGVSLDVFQDVNDFLTAGFEGTYAWVSEDTPSSVSSVDEDFSQMLLRPYIKVKNFTIGAGYYKMSDDMLVGNGGTLGDDKADDLKDIFIVDEMDPMEEDGVYGEVPNNETYFVDVEYTYGPFSIKAVYGMIDDARTDGGATTKGEADELDIVLGIELAKNLEAEFIYADVNDDYSGDGDDSHKLYGGAITYSF
jgi:hypothetical protein